MASEVIPDRATAYGKRVRWRLTDEMTIWLTTVGRDGTPQPNPVGFLRDGRDSLLTYNQTEANGSRISDDSRWSRSTYRRAVR